MAHDKADVLEPGVHYCQDWTLINDEPMTDSSGEMIHEKNWITVTPPVLRRRRERRWQPAPGTR